MSTIRFIFFQFLALAACALAAQSALADWRAVGRLSDHLPLVDTNCDFRLRVPGSGPAVSETVLPLSRAVTYRRADGAAYSQSLSFNLGLGDLLQFRQQGAFWTYIDFSDYFLNKGAFDAALTVDLYEPAYPSWQNASSVSMTYAYQGTTGRALRQTSQGLKDGFQAIVLLETRCVN